MKMRGTGYDNPDVIRRVWELSDNEHLSYVKIARIVKVPESTVSEWVRRRGHVQRELARREQAAKDEAARLRLRQRLLNRGRKPPAPPEAVAEIRRIYRTTETIAPGIVARTETRADVLAKRFGIGWREVYDIAHRTGKYAEAPR